jgi:uncharacterized membrane protein
MNKILKFVLIPAMSLSFSSCWTYKQVMDEETVYVMEWPDRTVYTVKKDGKVISRNIDDGTFVYSDTTYLTRLAARKKSLEK